MHNILVSIIIPVYKVEPYIVRCIESVLRQTYRNLEVILVDDSSPDRSMQIARDYIEQSPNSKDLKFIYLKHDHNRGLSAARNTGMNAATGEYIYFLDSDDEITPDSIEALVEPLENEKYDFVIGDYTMIGEYNYFQYLRVEGELSGNNLIAESYLNRGWYPMAWNKLCRLDYLKKNDMYFQEGLIHEDELWSFQLASTAKSMYAISSPTYIYFIRENSITTSNDFKKQERRIENCLRVLKGMYQYQEKHKLYNPEVFAIQNMFRTLIYNIMISAGFSIYNIYKSVKKTDTRKIGTKMKMYPSLRKKIIYFDVFLPPELGYFYKNIVRKYFAWRNHCNNYPFYINDDWA